MNYTTDIHGDLIFDGFEPMPGAPNGDGGHDFDLPSDSIWEIAPSVASGINPEQIVPSEDGWMDRTKEAAHSAALEPNTDSASNEVCVIGPSVSHP